MLIIGVSLMLYGLIIFIDEIIIERKRLKDMAEQYKKN